MTLYDVRVNCEGDAFISLNGELIEIVPHKHVPASMRSAQCICPMNCKHRKMSKVLDEED